MTPLTLLPPPMKIIFSRVLVAAVLLSNAACARQAVEARADFILGADHGWVDLAMVPDAGTVFDKPCDLHLAMNGETLLMTGVQMPRGGAAPAVGFRHPVPVGKLLMELTVSGCVPKAGTFNLPLDMAKDHLARLEFDGKAMRLERMTAFEPTTLEWVRTEVLKLQAENGSAAKAMEQLSLFAKASLGLNVLLLITLIAGYLRRRP